MKPWDMRALPPHQRAELITHYREHRLRDAHTNHIISKVMEEESSKKPDENKGYNPYAKFGIG